MGAEWTLERLRDGASGALGDYWKMSDPVLEFVSQDTGKLTMVQQGSLDDGWSFQPGDRVRLVRTDDSGAAVWFVGECRPSSQSGDPTNESLSYEFVDPWWQMERTVFRQLWNGYVPADSATGGFWTGHILMNVDQYGAPAGVQEQLAKILAYATGPTGGVGASAGVGLPFVFASGGLPDLNIWREEVRNITIAEAVRRQLRYLPGSACWFDHSVATGADAKPELRIAKLGDMGTVTLPMADGVHEGLQIARVWEQELPAVQIVYEQRNSVDGKELFSIYTDTAPSGVTRAEFAPGSLISNVDLSGFATTSIKNWIYTRPFNYTSLAWWARHVPALTDGLPGTFDVRNVSLMHRGASGEWLPGDGGLPYYANELADGVWASWMPIAGDNSGAESNCSSVGVSGEVRYRRSATGYVADEWVPMWGEVNTTDVVGGETGTLYSVVSSKDPGEGVPSGIAQFLYDVHKGPLFSGSVSYTEEECAERIGLGDRVSLDMLNASGVSSTASPDYALWRSMGATVQRVRYDLERGRTTVSFGPPKHLGLPDLVELLRQGRWRQRWTNPKVRAGGDMSVNATEASGRGFKEISSPGSKKGSRGSYESPGASKTGHIEFHTP